MCPHTTICVSSYYYMCPHTTIYMCPHTTTCVLILLHMCPHTTIYVSSHYYIFSSHYYICVLIHLYTYITCLAVAARRRRVVARAAAAVGYPVPHVPSRLLEQPREARGAPPAAPPQGVVWVWVCGCEQSGVCLDTTLCVYAYECSMRVLILVCVSACFCMYMCWLRLCKLKAAYTSSLRPHTLVA